MTSITARPSPVAIRGTSIPSAACLHPYETTYMRNYPDTLSPGRTPRQQPSGRTTVSTKKSLQTTYQGHFQPSCPSPAVEMVSYAKHLADARRIRSKLERFKFLAQKSDKDLFALEDMLYKIQSVWRAKVARRRQMRSKEEEMKQFEAKIEADRPEIAFKYDFHGGKMRILRNDQDLVDATEHPRVASSSLLPISDCGTQEIEVNHASMKPVFSEERHLGRAFTCQQTEEILKQKCFERFHRAGEAFRFADTAHTGKLTLAELKALLANLHLPVSFGTYLMDKLDVDKNGVLNYRDFQEYFGPLLQQGFECYIEKEYDHSSVFGRGLRKLA